jgi:hypothetical protein
MNRQKMHTYRSETPSLVLLKTTLTSARKGLPPRVAKKDLNEELALKLIEELKTQYKKYLRFIG